MRKSLLMVILSLLLMALAVPALADGAGGPADERLQAAIGFANENSYVGNENVIDELGVVSYLRAAWVMDVPASREGMAADKVKILDEYYGDYERVYVLDYAQQMGAAPIFYPAQVAVGEKADGALELCPTFSDVRARTYDFEWCAGAAIELVLDMTLAEAMAG